MSDIIIFPKLGDGLNRQLEDALAVKNYDLAYDIILEMERHFELSNETQLTKLFVLKSLESFLELREEASIMLNHGHPSYNEVVEYFLISLYELGQYRTVVELIHSLRSEQIDHQLIVKLLPLFDQAKHRLNEMDASFDINIFLKDPLENQLQFVIKLINNKNYKYKSSFHWLIMNQSLHPLVQTMVLEYLLEGEFEHPLSITKFNQHFTIDSHFMKPYESDFNTKVIPAVIDWSENNTPSMTTAIKEWLNIQNMLIYPIVLHDDWNVVAESLIIFAMQMFELHDAVNFNETREHLEIVEQLITMNETIAPL